MEGCVKLMETTYSGKFPPQYVDTFKKNIRYETANLSINILDSEQMECIRHLRASLENTSTVDKIFIKCFQLWNRVQSFTMKRYLFFRLHNYSWAYFIRIFNRYRKKPNQIPSLPKGIKLP